MTNGTNYTTSVINVDHSINIVDIAAINREDKNIIKNIIRVTENTEMIRIERSQAIFKNGDAS